MAQEVTMSTEPPVEVASTEDRFRDALRGYDTFSIAAERVVTLRVIHRLAGALLMEANELPPADAAVCALLNRIQTDADLGHLICPITESFTLLCAAESARTVEPVETVVERRRVSHAKYPRRFLSRSEWEEATASKRCVKCGATIEDPQLVGEERCEACADPS